jgi:hypothetical protein
MQIFENGHTWGNSKLKSKFMLVPMNAGYQYPGVDLETCTSQKAIDQRVEHLSHKTWNTDCDIADLRQALNDLLGGPLPAGLVINVKKMFRAARA